MSLNLKDVLPPDLADHIEKLVKDSPYSTVIDPAQVRSIQHLPLWRDSDIQRNIERVLDDPLFDLPRRLLAFETWLEQGSVEGVPVADEALALLADMRPELKGLITKSAVRMYELGLPFLAFTRTYARLNRLAKLGPTRAKEKGKDYPPHMALPDYGLTCPDIPDGAYFPERTAIGNPLVDSLIRFTANDVMLFLEGRKKAELGLRSERDKEERRLRAKLRIGKKPTRPRRRKQPSPTEAPSAATKSAPLDEGVPPEGVVSKVSKTTLSMRSAGKPASSRPRPRLDIAGIPARWRDLNDQEKYRAICEAMAADTKGIAITVDIDEVWMASRKSVGKDAMAEIQARLYKAFKAVFGSSLAFAAVIETDRVTKPHLHGVINLAPDPANQELVRQALLRFTGAAELDGRRRARRTHTKQMDDPVYWGEYPFKRHATARSRLGSHRVVITSRPAVQLGRALQDQRRAAALRSSS